MQPAACGVAACEELPARRLYLSPISLAQFVSSLMHDEQLLLQFQQVFRKRGPRFLKLRLFTAPSIFELLIASIICS